MRDEPSLIIPQSLSTYTAYVKNKQTNKKKVGEVLQRKENKD